jgi:MFS family permease
VGITEAIIMTCATALVADYFHGSDRERWLAVQTGGGGVVAVTMVALGGILGQGSWRFPFAMYGIAFILFPLVLFKTWEPVKHAGLATKHGFQTAISHPEQPAAVKYNWGPLALICLITLFASMAFYVVIIQLSFILTERGVTAPGTIGLGCAVAVLFGVVGAVLFKLLRLPVAGKLALSFIFSSVGFFVLALSHSFLLTEVGASINSLGSGMVLPTLLTWALSKLSLEVRARGTGVWQTAMFLGQFLSPLAILFLKNTSGSESNAVLVFAIACAVAAVLALMVYFRAGSQPLMEAE